MFLFFFFLWFGPTQCEQEKYDKRQNLKWTLKLQLHETQFISTFQLDCNIEQYHCVLHSFRYILNGKLNHDYVKVSYSLVKMKLYHDGIQQLFICFTLALQLNALILSRIYLPEKKEISTWDEWDFMKYFVTCT